MTLDNFTYFHLCNHRIRKSNRDGEVKTLTVESSKNLIDVLINGAVVLEIYEVRAIDYDKSDAEIIDFYYDNNQREQTYDDVDPGESYYDEKEAFIINYAKYFKDGESVSEPLPTTFYEPTLHNRIRWIVKPPTRYQVKAKVKYTYEAYDNYSPVDCPICGGKGWFIDILNKDGEFEVPIGIIKVAQRVVKDFLTEIGTQSYDPTYGTTVKYDAMKNSADDESVFNSIRAAASLVEDQYLTDQQNIIASLTDDEILLSLTVEDVYRMTQKPTVTVIQLRIRTQTDEQVFKFGY
ncbi:hypothetical protein [Priestia megaterium]|uniref:hypothetical protein n=2 Tax=Priestia megaterium TaxID=1404 RepID=UPI002E22F948|nr:hypothetical protein [Priestia megaterium]